ncbi:MAG: hypothetical protein RR280_03045 [Bacteroidaceae bacterium]
MNKSTINNSTNQIQGSLFALSSLESKKVEASFTLRLTTEKNLQSMGSVIASRRGSNPENNITTTDA